MSLVEGLIIDKEENEDWVLEAVLHAKDVKELQPIAESEQMLIAETKITKQTNAPAFFAGYVKEINILETEANVIMKGILVREEIETIFKKGEMYQKQQISGEEILAKWRST